MAIHSAAKGKLIAVMGDEVAIPLISNICCFNLLIEFDSLSFRTPV